MSTTFLDELVAALRRSAAYNRNDMVAPITVLWPDANREWEPVIPALRAHLPILTLGDYSPESLTGPAVWIRCLVARALPEADWPPEAPPVIYLPGFSRFDLRAIEDCPEPIKLLAELQYRGVIWSQKNGRDWTLAAFLQTADGGLSIPVVGNGATTEALRRAAAALLDVSVQRLRDHQPIRAEYLNALLAPDVTKQMLQWMNDPAGEREKLTGGAWEAFREQARERLGLDPERDGELAAAEKLGAGEGAWAEVWERFKEAPRRYPMVAGLLCQVQPKDPLTLFESATDEHWPQDNKIAEEQLRLELLALRGEPSAEARSTIARLEEKHRHRRAWVWAELDESRLAQALEHLSALAEETRQPLGGSSVADMAERYRVGGWKADAVALGALACAPNGPDQDAVKAAVRVCYEPWLRDGCERFQQLWAEQPPEQAALSREPEAGVVHLYVDGLRLDLGHALRERLSQVGAECTLDYRLAPLPTVTATAKPAASPVAGDLRPGPNLSPVANQEAELSAEGLRRLLAAKGFQVLQNGETGDPTGSAWTECGRLDEIGHIEGCALSHRATEELEQVARRAQELLEAGWREVRIVTDHGWLLLPGGLPSHSLPEAATKVRKGRCARLKPGSQTDCQTVAWYWDRDVRIAVAPGLSCFFAGQEFEHGGLSPQEVVVPEIAVRSGAVAAAVAVAAIRWTKLRCRVQLTGEHAGVTVDLRTRPADRATSVASGAKAVDAQGAASLVCPDESLEGTAAVLVALRGTQVVAQQATVIGAESNE